MKLSDLFLALLLVVNVFASHPTKTEQRGTRPKLALNACQNVVNKMKWAYNSTGGGRNYGTICNYPPAVGTITNCFANIFGPFTKNFNKTIGPLSLTCETRGSDTVIHEKQFYIDQFLNATGHFGSTEGLNLTETKLTFPVDIPHNVTKPYYDYTKFTLYNWDMPNVFAGIYYCYFIFVFLIVGIVNYMKRLGYQGSLNNKWITLYRKHISIPALFNQNHTNAPVYFKFVSTLVPTRVETLIIFFFVCLNILLATIHYNVSTLYNSRRLQLTMLVADRTALLAFGMIPLLVLFAGRNNLMIRLTGIPYTSFIMFHKWVSRMMFLYALIHSACWTDYAISRHYMSAYVARRYWRWGIVATTLAGLLCFQAFHMFRTMSYESFLFIHIVFASLFLVGCWWHCYDFGYLEWIYASIALWCTDRLVRIFKMITFGYRNADVEYISDGTFKVSVQKGAFFHSYPGAYAFLYFLTPYGFWQSHPFTIIESALKEGEITVYIKAKKGMTKYIKNKCIKAGGKASIRVSVEGPYGHHAPSHKYDTALLLAGGSGIPGPYHHAVDLAKRDSNQQIKLSWTIRNPESLCWFYKELMMLRGTKVQCDIYITGTVTEFVKETGQDKEKASSSASDSDTSLSPQGCIEELSKFITFHYERPSLEDFLVTEFTAENQGTICVMTCGPPRMVDDIRKFVGQNLDKCPKRVDLFEELQVW